MNKKRFLTLKFILILLVASLFFSGCITINTDTSLVPDVHFHNETNVLTWSPIKGAYQYEILFEDQTVIKSYKSTYDLSSIAYGEYSVKVRALNLLGSPVSQYSSSTYVKIERPLSEVLDLLSSKYVSANVKVVVRKETFNEIYVYDGSGVIFKKENRGNTSSYTYYCLTNNHVVVKNLKPSYFVVDHLGVSHNATLVCNSDAYDLAVVTFNSDSEFETLEFSSDEPRINDKIIALGNPLGSLNAVTAGNITDLTDVINVPESDGYDYSNVEFNIITHDAIINSGSSGGALISYDFKIVGINYATGNKPSTHEFVEGYAVPHVKVKEYLTLNGITY